jgi:acyl dehydratase
MPRCYFEDCVVGERHSFGSCRVDRDEVINFARQFDPQPFHLDDAEAAKTPFGRIAASGWHTCAMTMRMMVDYWAEIGLQSMGSPGVEDLRWLKPVYPGDLLHVEFEWVEKRASRSRPEIGLAKGVWRTINQDGDAVCSFTATTMIRARLPAAAT